MVGVGACKTLLLPAEFIRMAARFGATIVPFAGVGVDDSLNLILDSKEVEQLPLVGQYIQKNTGQTPQVGG